MQSRFHVGDVASLLRHALMSASYKPALLKALVRLCRRRSELNLTLAEIGDEFARMYWNQTVIFHLRQASALSKEAEVIRAIRTSAHTYGVRRYGDLPEAGRADLAGEMARILTLNVLDAFHRSKPSSMPTLYEWKKGQKAIALTEESHAFLRQQGAPLEILANYYWAEFLETRNRLAPRIIAKVEHDGPPRSSLQNYLKILTMEDDAACFYCGIPYDGITPFAVDHVIPRSFLMEDPLWDLVLACQRCNNSKSDWLPESAFMDRLLHRNATNMKVVVGNKISLLAGADDAGRLYEAAISLEWPRFWRPG